MFRHLIRRVSVGVAGLLTIILIYLGKWDVAMGAVLSFCSIAFAATFGEEIVEILRDYPREKDIPVTRENGFAYLQGNERIIELTKTHASVKGLKFARAMAGNDHISARFDLLGDYTLRDLDRFVKKYGQQARRLSDHWRNDREEFSPDDMFGYVLDVALYKEEGVEALRVHWISVVSNVGGWERDERSGDYADDVAQHVVADNEPKRWFRWF